MKALKTLQALLAALKGFEKTSKAFLMKRANGKYFQKVLEAMNHTLHLNNIMPKP